MGISMAAFCGCVLCVFIGLLALTVLVWIWLGRIDLSDLINEANGQASLSRFQLLIFTFVIAISLFIIVESGGKFPEIPTGVLTLLGISASTYAVGKGISYSQPEVMMQGKTHADEAKSHAEAAQTAANEAKTHAQTAQQAADKAGGKST